MRHKTFSVGHELVSLRGSVGGNMWGIRDEEHIEGVEPYIHAVFVSKKLADTVCDQMNAIERKGG